MDGSLPPNVDGSSCFLNALITAIFVPVVPAIDAILLSPSARPITVDDDPVRFALHVVARIVRGTQPAPAAAGDWRAIRPALCAAEGGARFLHGQQDPGELLDYLLQTTGGAKAALFGTHISEEKVYAPPAPGVVETRVEMNRVCHGAFSDLAAVFPRRGGEAELPRNEYSLLRTSHVEELLLPDSGALVFSVDKLNRRPCVYYGARDAATRAFFLSVATAGGGAQRLMLHSVVVWQGALSLDGAHSSGHYAAYAYDARRLCWVFYDDAAGAPQDVPEGESPETWPRGAPRFTYGLSKKTQKRAARDNVTGALHLFESSHDEAVHAEQHEADMCSAWRPSAQGVLFIYSPCCSSSKRSSSADAASRRL
jgi:hypothetical protein